MQFNVSKAFEPRDPSPSVHFKSMNTIAYWLWTIANNGAILTDVLVGQTWEFLIGTRAVSRLQS